MSRKHIILFFSFLLLTSCAEKEFSGLACPQIGILQDYNTINHPDFRAEFGDFSGKCTFKRDAIKVSGKIDIQMKQNKPVKNEHNLNVFFALIDPEENIIEKITTNVQFKFDQDSFYAVIEEAFELNFHTKNQFDAQKYEILIGFQK